MDSQIEEFVKKCSPRIYHQTAPPAENTPWPRTDQSWQRVHVDHFYFTGDCYLLVVDANSNWIELEVLLRKKILSFYGSVSPGMDYRNAYCLTMAPPFNSLEFKELLRKNNVYHLTSPAYNPSSNGIAEVSVRIIKKSLEKSLEESPNSNMDCILQNVLFNYRNTPTSLDKPPVERLLSYVPRTFVNCLNSEFIQRTFGRNECGRRHFQVGDKVLFTRVIQNRHKWFKAQVIRLLGYNVYLVKNLKGTFKVHVNQMRTGSDTKYAEDSDWTLDNAGAGPHRLEQEPPGSTSSPPPRRSIRPRLEQDPQVSTLSPPPRKEDLSGDGGVRKRVVEQGKGSATPSLGNKLVVDYRISLQDGTLVETRSQLEKGERRPPGLLPGLPGGLPGGPVPLRPSGGAEGGVPKVPGGERRGPGAQWPAGGGRAAPVPRCSEDQLPRPGAASGLLPPQEVAKRLEENQSGDDEKVDPQPKFETPSSTLKNQEGGGGPPFNGRSGGFGCFAFAPPKQALAAESGRSAAKAAAKVVGKKTAEFLGNTLKKIFQSKKEKTSPTKSSPGPWINHNVTYKNCNIGSAIVLNTPPPVEDAEIARSAALKSLQATQQELQAQLEQHRALLQQLAADQGRTAEAEILLGAFWSNGESQPSPKNGSQAQGGAAASLGAQPHSAQNQGGDYGRVVSALGLGPKAASNLLPSLENVGVAAVTAAAEEVGRSVVCVCDFKLKELDQMLDHMMVADAEEDTINCEIEEAEHYSDTFITLERKVRELIDSDNKSDVKSLGSSNESSMAKSYKLPKIEIRKFDGELINWLPHFGHNLKRFMRILSCMMQTSFIIWCKSYPQTAENYAKAVQALKQRYGQKDLLVEIYVRELLKLMMANVKTPPDERRSVAKLYDKLKHN
ncbi:K02A2.6-like [Cordylochernes scorpioides]|uniref:K02A2.6-like n=1 Tax=Cordylochernes scorpioides TaxID=51811 RepID=A0ABY6LV25_9ARAC|nr:K02A2.6-like [Cordylochernes scorpioides]